MSDTFSPLKKGLILFSILVVPSLLYLVLTTGKHNFIHLQYFGPKETDSVQVNGSYRVDTVYHKVGGFSLLNQEGKTITDKDLEGKFYVANFFFTTCPSICPKMTSELYRVQQKYPAVRELRFLSFSVNPEKDTVAALADYAKRYLVNKRKWHLLTGDKKQIYDLARNSFLLSVQEGTGGPEDFIHSEQLVLVDKERHIRGYYDGTDPKEVDRLIDEIKVLTLEYKEKQRNGSSPQ
jgi:protein SCO1